MAFVIRSTFDGQPAEFAWLGPDEWHASPGVDIEVEALIADGEPLGLTHTGPFVDADPTTMEGAFALARAAFDANGDPIELVEGTIPEIPSVPEGAVA